MPKIAFVSTYIPRRCGIATFTHDLATAVGDHEIVALHQPDGPGPYPIEVRHLIRSDNRADYADAARALNDCGVEAVLITSCTSPERIASTQCGRWAPSASCCSWAW